MSTFPDLARNGIMAELSGDDTPESICDRLGTPDDISAKGNPRILRYGPLQLSFLRADGGDTKTLGYFSLSLGPGWKATDRLGLAGWWPEVGLGVDSLRDHLRELKIAEAGHVESVTTLHLLMPSGVRVTFSDGSLESIHGTFRVDSPTKQVSIHLPEADARLIGEIAREGRMTVGALCSKWIGEHLRELSRAGAAKG